MKFDAGDLVVVPFPFTDLTSKKWRPALVLSSQSFNESQSDAILCAVTSNLTNSENSVLLEASDLRDGHLPATSRIKVAKLVTLEQRLIAKRVGRIKPGLLERVYRELLTILNVKSA